MWRRVVLLVLAVATFATTEPSRTVFTTITDSESGEFDVSYPNEVHSERELPICEPHAACSAMHRRFWYNIKLERLCRCPNQYQCPREWSDDHQDNHTMMLNNRSQLKFCQPVANMTTCSPKQPALTVSAKSSTVSVPYNRTVTITFVSVVASCRCGQEHYWKLHRQVGPNKNNTITSTYRCTKLRKCNSDEFCGHIRADHFSAYYQCSCPTDHWCVFTDRNLHNATELLYNGPAYKAVCFRHTPTIRTFLFSLAAVQRESLQDSALLSHTHDTTPPS